MIFGNLINLGVKSEMEFYQKREARIVNLFALITLLGLLIGVSSVIFISGDYVISTVLFTTLTSLTILLLNYKLYHNAATYVFVITINVTIFILNQQYIDTVGNYLYYFPVIFCVALIHNPVKSNTRTAIFFSIVLVSFLCSRLFDIPYLKNATITEADNAALLTYNSVLAFMVTLILVFLVVRLINRQNNEVSTINLEAVFIAIGHKPNTDIFKDWITQDETGYIVVAHPGTSKTNIPGVFASGDAADKVYRQAITAAGTGCMAALDAERYLTEKGLH